MILTKQQSGATLNSNEVVYSMKEKTVHDRLFNTDINNITYEDYLFYNEILSRKSFFNVVFGWIPLGVVGIVGIFIGVMIGLGVGLSSIIPLISGASIGILLATGQQAIKNKDKFDIEKCLGITLEDWKTFKKQKGLKRIKRLVKEYKKSDAFKEGKMSHEIDEFKKAVCESFGLDYESISGKEDEKFYEIFPDMRPKEEVEETVTKIENVRGAGLLIRITKIDTSRKSNNTESDEILEENITGNNSDVNNIDNSSIQSEDVDVVNDDNGTTV